MVRGDPRGTQAWRRLRDQVVSEEPTCQLRFPDICTHWSETADHIATVHDRPDLALERSNHRGACHACNRHRGERPGHEDATDSDGPPAPALSFFE